MITILHGENSLASRKKLEEIKSAFAGEVVVLDGKTVSETNFVQATQSNSLLQDKRLVVMEGLPKFSLKNLNGELVVWEGKKLGSLGDLGDLGNLKIEEYKTPAVIFKLTDSLRPGNGKTAVKIFRECLKSLEVEYVFLMVVWAFRQRQDKAKLNQLLEIDYQNKQGLLVKDLPLALELFLLSL